MFDLDPNQVEKYFAQNTVFQVEFAAVEFKFNMETLFNADLHFNGSILIWFLTKVCNYELFLLCNSIVVSVYHDVDIIAQPYYDPIVALKLFFNSIELEIILYAICKRTRRFEISYNLKECRVLILVVQVFYDAYQFYSYTHMINFFALVKLYAYLALNVFSILYDNEKNDAILCYLP